MSAPWTAVLTNVAEQLNGIRIEWMLVGSAATALHGVEIVPGDIDIAVLEAGDVARAAAVLPTPDGPLVESQDPADWVSTAAEPALRFEHAGERWTFGKWMIDGVKVELAHIDAPAVAARMMETRALLVWHERETLNSHGQPVPTVPVEVQLATMVARQQDARIHATIAAIDTASVDVTLLRRALSDRRSEVPDLTVPESVQRLLAE
ncbi:nucleotidyltransferase family protein [Kribbella endophytica]